MTAPIKKYYEAQLACLYGIDKKEMHLRLRDLVPVMGEKIKSEPYSEKEVEYIFRKLGHPQNSELAKRGRKSTGNYQVRAKKKFIAPDVNFDIDKKVISRKLAEIDYCLMVIDKNEIEKTVANYMNDRPSVLKSLLSKRLIDFAQAELYRDYSEPLNKAS